MSREQEQGVGNILQRLNGKLRNLSIERQSLLGEFQFTTEMVTDFVTWTKMGTLYAGSDRSVEDGRGAHSFVWTSGVRQAAIWGGSATTPGNQREMASQRAEHAGSAAILLVLKLLHEVLLLELDVVLWVDNAEVVRRGGEMGNFAKWNDTLVLDYDLWMLTRAIQTEVSFKYRWEKVDSHVVAKLRADPTRTIKGNKLAW